MKSKKIKNWIPICFIFIFGCAAMLPNIESLNPNGYSELVEMAPECKEVDLHNYSDCHVAAEMLEVSPQKATAKFISHWEETAFGSADRMEKSGEVNHDMLDSIVWGDVKYKAMATTQKIAVPILEKIYKRSNDEYSKSMLPQIDLIDIKSKSSFDSFREIHTKAVSSYPPSSPSNDKNAPP